MVKTLSGVTNQTISDTLRVNKLRANNSLGSAGQVLHSNGTATYWAADDDTNTTYDFLAIANTTTNQGIVRLKDSANANDDVQFVGANGVVVSSNATHVLITGQVDTNTDTNTTYDLLAITNTAANEGRVRLKDSANANDDVLYTGTGSVTVSSNSTHVIINSPTDTNTTYDLLHIANTVANEGRIRLKDVNNSNDDIVVVGGNGLVVSSNTTAVLPAVLANTGIVANATGVFVNTSYIATISANSATYLNSATNFGNSAGITAPAFYDSANTTFVVDPASTTKLKTVNIDDLGWSSIVPQFGQRSNALNELTDLLFQADKRFTVTNGSGVYFDGDFGSSSTIPVSTTRVININMANQSGVPAIGVTYPQGFLYLSFYSTFNNYSSISVRTRHNGTWVIASAPIDISSSNTLKVLQFSVPGNNFLTDIEITIVTNATDEVWLSSINYFSTRFNSGELELPFVSKHATTNYLFGSFGVKNNSGVINNLLSGTTNSYLAATAGNVGIGNTAPAHKLSVNGTSYFQANVTFTSALIANGGAGSAGEVLHSNGTATYWAVDDNTNTTYDLLAIANTAANEGRVRLKDSANANDDVLYTGTGGAVVSSNATHVIINAPVDTNTTYDLLTVANAAANEARVRLKDSANANDDILIVGANGITTFSNSTAGYAFAVGSSTVTVNTSGIHVNPVLSITDLTVSGNLSVLGDTVTLNVASIAIEDSLVEFARNQDDTATFTDALDIGFYGSYGNTANSWSSGLFRDQSDSGVWKIFQSNGIVTNTNINTTNTSLYGLAPLRASSFGTTEAGYGSATGGALANATVVAVGNTTANVVAGYGTFTLSNNMIANSTFLSHTGSILGASLTARGGVTNTQFDALTLIHSPLADGDINDAISIRMLFNDTVDAPNIATQLITGKEETFQNPPTRSAFLAFHTRLDDTLSEKVRITAAGNVGIGTISPNTKFHVVSGTNVLKFPQTDGGDVGLQIEGTGAGHAPSIHLKNAAGYYRLAVHSTDGSFRAFNGTDRLTVLQNGNIGIGTTTPTYKLEVVGSFAATTKSFVIDHPTKPDMKLRYGSLEGPENGVYVRGRSNTNIIELPDYWSGLVDESSITVNLTPIGKKQELYVKNISNNSVVVGGSRSLDYYYTIFAERKDVEKLVVEY